MPGWKVKFYPRPPRAAENLKKSKYFLDHPTVLKGNIKDTSTYQEDPRLMPGWKVKFYPRPPTGGKPGRNDRVFLTPENMQIRSSFGVAEYMRCFAYSPSKIK